MTELLSQFHFLRPLWLLMTLPCVIVLAVLWQQQQQQGSWSRVIAPELLSHLIQGQEQTLSRWPLKVLALGWMITCLALAGPTWQKIPVPVSKSMQPLVVVADLSYAMYASDMSPNRLTRTRYKLLDLMRLRTDGHTALVAFAGSAHTVSPLTDDIKTLSNLVPALTPEIMPEPGKNPVSGIELAVKLLEQGASESGDILLITDTVSNSELREITSLVQNGNHRLSVLGIGTEEGAPVSLPGGGFIKDRSGTIVVPQRDSKQLQGLAQSTGGKYQDMVLNDSDLKSLLPAPGASDQTVQVERQFDLWHDAGYWLALLLLPLALVGFRRGWLVLVVIGITLPTPEAQAFEWQSLWKNDDQRAMEALKDNDPKTAAELFTRPDWKAEALYQSGDYQQAAKEFEKLNTAEGYYNQGNALSKNGNLDEALEAYDKALAMNPGLEDAKQNKKQVEEMKKRREQQQDTSGQNQGEGQDQQNEKNGQKPSSAPQQNGDEHSQNQQGDASKDNSERNQSQSGDHENSQAPESGEAGREGQQDKEQQYGQSGQQPSDQEEENQGQKIAGEQTDDPSDEQQEQFGQQAVEGLDAINPDMISPDKQAIDNWLQTIPDDPGGLLRRKFLYQQQQREQQRRQEQAW